MTDKRLILLTIRAQTGDRRALDQLLGELQAGLFDVIRALVNDEALAADVLQDVLILIVRKVRWLREPRAVRAWSYTIARREAVRAAKRSATDIQRSSGFGEELPAPQAPEIDWAALRQALEEVPEASRRVIELHYEADLTIAEVGQRLQIPVGTVKSRLAYGLDAFRKALARRRLAREDLW